MADIEYKIINHMFKLKSTGTFHKELNLISWNKRDPVYDLRGWNEDRSKMTKGITLTMDEFEELVSKIKEEF